MKLKLYQEKVLNTLLSALTDFRAKYQNALAFDADIARDYNFPKRAFASATNKISYHSKLNRLGAKKEWKELFNEFPNHNFEFQVVFEDEWQNEINKLVS